MMEEFFKVNLHVTRNDGMRARKRPSPETTESVARRKRHRKRRKALQEEKHHQKRQATTTTSSVSFTCPRVVVSFDRDQISVQIEILVNDVFLQLSVKL